jgi:hypothetical protein
MTRNQKIELLTVPRDEIGWSDESFNLAYRYVMRTTNLAEVLDMRDWLRENLAKDIRWFSAQYATRGIFKSYLVGIFRGFDPSAMQHAYDAIKQHPKPHLQLRTVIYTILNGVIITFGIGFVVFIILGLLGSILSSF